jgi:hypothetical protein
MSYPASNGQNQIAHGPHAQLSQGRATASVSDSRLSPEAEDGMKRFIPKAYAFYGMNNKNKLTDYLADPNNNINNVTNAGFTVITGIAFLVNLLGSRKNPEYVKNAVWAGLAFTGLGLFPSLSGYENRQNQNRDILNGVKTLGATATLEDWQKYKNASQNQPFLKGV